MDSSYKELVSFLISYLKKILYQTEGMLADQLRSRSRSREYSHDFCLFFGGSSSELLILLLELESESESEDEVSLDEEVEEDEELSVDELSSSLLLVPDVEELDDVSLSDEESVEVLLLLLLMLWDLFFFIFFSVFPCPLVGNASLFCLSFKVFFNCAVRDGLCRYFRFPVHS